MLQANSDFRYIKLGKAGDREVRCIEEGTCFIGFITGQDEFFQKCVDASQSRSDDVWEQIRQEVINSSPEPDSRKSKQNATSAVNQVREVYEAEISTTWITFHAGKLYWANIDPESKPWQVHGGSLRKTLNGWSCLDGHGDEMFNEALAGSVTKLQMYRGTSCELDAASSAYLQRRLSGKQQPYIEEIQKAKLSLKKGVQAAISTLTPGDFELLVELIFSKTLKRISSTGKTQKFVDIVFENPLAAAVYGDNAPICVQVKCRTTIAELEEYLASEARETYSMFYFVFHSSADLTSDYAHDYENVVLVGIDRLADLAISNGLLDWIELKSG